MRKYIGSFFIILIPLMIGFLYYRYYGVNGDMWSSQCTFHALTGLQCPGCGGQRAFYSLLHGNFLIALRYNILMIVLLPFLLYTYYLLAQVYILKNKKYLKYFNLPSNSGYIFLIVLVIYFLLRNIPLYPFYYLSPPQ